MGGDEDWRKTHKMSSEEVDPSKRPNHQQVLHQRRRMPYSTATMAVAGLAIVGAIAYFTLFSTKKPEASAIDVAKVTTGIGNPDNTRPRK